jgi:hypothetical protein
MALNYVNIIARPLKFTQIAIFGLKACRLATQGQRPVLKIDLKSVSKTVS